MTETKEVLQFETFINSKFLRRRVFFNLKNTKILNKLIQKKLFLKDLSKSSNSQEYIIPAKDVPQRRELVTLEHLDLKTTTRLESYLPIIKSCKRLKYLNLSVSEGTSFYVLMAFFKRLPKNIQVINLYCSDIHAKSGQIEDFYQNLATFRKLTTFSRKIDYQPGLYYTKQEYYSICKYFRRLKNLSNFCYTQNSSNQVGLQRLLEKDFSFPFITNLSLSIDEESFETFDQVNQMLEEPENSDESQPELDMEVEAEAEAEAEAEIERDKNSLSDDKELEEKSFFEDEEIELEDNESSILNPHLSAEEIATLFNTHPRNDEEEEEGGEPLTQEERALFITIDSEMPPFFKFHLFENLKVLTIHIVVGCGYPISRCVIQGFRSLKKLQQLVLGLDSRPVGSHYFFRGFCELPQLKEFSLALPFIRHDEFKLLSKFLTKQKKLQTLSLSIKTARTRQDHYDEENLFLQRIGQCLRHKSRLKTLILKSINWTLESLSEGLRNSPLLKRIKNLEVGVFDDFILSKLAAPRRIRGFCQFLQRHSHLLKSLKIELPILENEVLINKLLEPVSNMETLTDLSLSINKPPESERREYHLLFKYVFPIPLNEATPVNVPAFLETFSILEETLEQLQALSTLCIELGPLFSSEQLMDLTCDPSVVLNAVFKMRALEIVNLRLPYLHAALESHPERLLKVQDLPYLKSINLRSSGMKRRKIISDFLKKTNLIRDLRTDLMF